MYRVYCDGFLLYHSKLENLQIFGPSVELELNKTGSFVFSIYPDHPYYGKIRKMKSIITAWQEDYLLFRGRVLDEERGWNNQKAVTCEGDMAFLLDSIQRPGSFTGTAGEYLAYITETHNRQVEPEKRFSVGFSATTEPFDIERTEYTTSLEALQKGLLDTLGGYIRTREENGTIFLDYLQDFTLLAPQKVEFGTNLLDLKRIRKGADIATAVIPLGKDGLTIAAVNGGLDYVQDDDAVTEYGFIVKTVKFEEITDAAELMRKGKAYLAELVKFPETVELSAADLATDGKDFASFHLGTYVQVTSAPHGINQRFLVSKLSVKLLNPAENKLTMGGTISTFTSATVGVLKGVQGPPGEAGRDGQDATVLRIDSSRGTVFKNSEVSTTLTVAVYHGDLRITTREALVAAFGPGAYLEWSWQRMDDQAFGVISASDSRIRDDGFSLVLTPVDVDTKATFQCKLIL